MKNKASDSHSGFAVIVGRTVISDRGDGDCANTETVPATYIWTFAFICDPDRWRYAFYKYSDEKYAPSLGAHDGGPDPFAGTPEAAFDCSARLYLNA